MGPKVLPGKSENELDKATDSLVLPSSSRHENAYIHYAPREPRSFQLTDDYYIWKEDVKSYLQHIQPAFRVSALYSFLDYSVREQALNFGFQIDTSLDQNWSALDKAFGPPDQSYEYFRQLSTRKQRAGESARDYLNALISLARKGAVNHDEASRQDLILRYFVLGVANDDLRGHFRRVRPNTIEEALTVATNDEEPGLSSDSNYSNFEKRPSYTYLPYRSNQPDLPQPSGYPTRGRSWQPHQQHPPGRARNFASNRDCYYCKKFGEMARHCGHNDSAVNGKSRFVYNLNTNSTNQPLSVHFIFDAKDYRALLDTGASMSLVNEKVVRTKTNLRFLNKRRTLMTADGNLINSSQDVVLTFSLGNRSYSHSFVICPKLEFDAILGMDFIRLHSLRIEAVPFAVFLDNAKLEIFSNDHNAQEVAKKSLDSGPINNVTLPGTPHEYPELNKLIQHFSTLFEYDTNPGRTNLVQHTIDTGSNKPIHQPARRLPVHYEERLNDTLKQMLNMHVIKPSHSPWSSPIVLVNKKDGSLRVCVDYRKLNSITKRDSFPLPRIDTTLDALYGASWFSTLDLASGYWQVEVKPEDREKTAFIVPSGLYEFETMPFGLCNAPATFQRLMQVILGDLVPKQCLIYLDDIIVHGKSVQEHNTNLRKVLQRLLQANLRLKNEKCRFLKEEVSFLGHIISAKGIRTDEAKTLAIKEYPEPKSTKQVRSFLGLASYYRRFVKNFSVVAAPLHRLTHKGRKFQWTKECKEAFEELKQRLISAPILAFPDISNNAGCFILDTDASGTAVGGVLSQFDSNGVEHVIAYASRILDKCETKYCTTKRELLAVITFLKHFRPYLLGKPFKLRTDHRSLTWLQNFKEPEGQLARWQERLQEYTFEIVYRKGSSHGNADALSRIPEPSSEQINAVLDAGGDINWDELQVIDPYIQLLYDRQRNSGLKPSGREMADQAPEAKCLWNKWSDLRFIGDVLFLSVPQGEPKLIVPLSKISDVIGKVHKDIGHGGQRKTEAAVRKRFWWPSVHHDVLDYCRKCNVCARTKQPNITMRAPLQPMLVEGPNQRVGVDVIGPLSVTRAGNRYVLVMVDYFTKWCEAVPMKNQDATSIANIFFNTWVCRFGAPCSLHSDQGSAFEGHIIAGLCNILNIQKTRTTSYHPEGNGLVERTNRTVKGILRAYLDESQSTEWDQHLPKCLLAYRASVHATTGFTPAKLLFGSELRLPSELTVPILPIKKTRYPQHVVQLHDRMTEAYRLVKEHSETASLHQKENYDKRVHGPAYHIGDTVWLRNHHHPSNLATSLQVKWNGPYEIVHIHSPTNFVVRHVYNPRDVGNVHYNHIKPAVWEQHDNFAILNENEVPEVGEEVEVI